MSGLRQRVFLSYSRLPEENSAFVRELARILRANGYEPWLDEEQIPGATNFEAEIRKAITSARHGVFILTKRWLERPYTRMELNLFARHDADTHYRIGINREGIDPLDVAQLQQLHIIDWRPDDPEPDARLWEVFAALTRRRPGPRDEWAEKGRRLLVGQAAPETSETPPEPERPAEPVWVPCTAQPMLALSTRDSTVLLTDGTECFRVNSSGVIKPIAPLEAWAAAAVGGDGTLSVGQYNLMLVRLRGDDWEYRSLDAPPLALMGCPQGLVVGDSAGGVTLFPMLGEPEKAIPFGVPVSALCPTENGVVALGVSGRIGRANWTGGGFSTYTLPEIFDRPTGLFDLLVPERVGLYSAEAVALLELNSGRVRVGKKTFPDGIRTIISLDRYPDQIAVMTDTGRLFYLQADLETAQPVPLPVEPAEVAGICRVGTVLLAWTVGGVLFLVARDRTVRKIATMDVVLAYPDPADGSQVFVVRWNGTRGVQVQPVRIHQTK